MLTILMAMFSRCANGLMLILNIRYTHLKPDAVKKIGTANQSFDEKKNPLKFVMKLLIRVLFLYIPGLLLSILLLASLVIWQQNLISLKQLGMLIEYVRIQDTATVVAEIRAELFGTAEWETDPSYDRQPVKGRGHSPWVMRGNLDQKPRMLSFALAPGVWASYETESASLYQVLQGELLLEGAAYDHRHGPQPRSSGAWYVRYPSPSQWYLQVSGSEELLPATVRYLGHEYGSGHKTAALRFVVSTDQHSLELTETPELLVEEGNAWLLRQFQQYGETSALSASFRDANNNVTRAQGNVRVELGGTTAIHNVDYKRISDTSEGQLERGKAVIANSDCLGCHNDQQQLVGPPWSQVSGRYRGKIQDATLASLARSIRLGSANKWGQVPMPAHPTLSLDDAVSAVAYILSRTEVDVEQNIPVDANGLAYVSSRDYDINPRLEELHPAFTISNLLPEGFEPKVGGMDFTADGKLLVASWDQDGAVFQIDTEALGEKRVLRIAEGLQEPLGLKVIGDRLFVLQKQELTELIDYDGDGIIDQYRTHSYDWPSSSNFHSFAFGLVHRDDALYALLSICVMPGGAACSDQLPTQGKLLRIALEDGSAEVVASGFRTPNGIALGPQKEIFVTDNEGDWLPASKLLHVQMGNFYGSRAVPDAGVMLAVETPPVVWLPHNEIGNSPTQPLLLSEGPYAGQMIHGDVYNGGIKRVYMERVGGALQGAVLQFSGGLQSGVNRLIRGPDGDIYAGEIGNPPNWGQLGKVWYGLERLSYSGKPAYEILQVNAQSDGFTLTLTEPLDTSLALEPGDLIARQWFYHPTEQYGGPKYDYSDLSVAALELSDDRRRIRARIPGLKPRYVVYLRLHQRLLSIGGQKLWADEAWYTLNAIPEDEGN
ncbi:MAG: c-type cytochrome [Halioglobus sp.]